ncbi:hypothetical protein GCM10023228_09530 [Brevibacillus fulvus]|uniref:Flagellar basal body-associated protein FliL n=1 Tax=Brevibacillus fulvus TaxID=1125967 RepID=A0A938XSB8_9BACL|nr:flagellar basal body-associated protein FliL [Brevibacillus fulvus]
MSKRDQESNSGKWVILTFVLVILVCALSVGLFMYTQISK